MFAFFDGLLYGNFELVAKQWHVFWLYCLSAWKVNVEFVSMLFTPVVKLSVPHIQLHLIGGLPEVLSEHCKVIGSLSFTDKELKLLSTGSVEGASE